jgi:hypothetical protein
VFSTDELRAESHGGDEKMQLPTRASYVVIGVGALVAKELMDEPQDLLEPFRFSRHETENCTPLATHPSHGTDARKL